MEVMHVKKNIYKVCYIMVSENGYNTKPELAQHENYQRK